MLTYAATLAGTETAVAQPAAGSSTQRDCASFVLYPDGRILSWNQPAEQMLGYSEEQALGRHFAWVLSRGRGPARRIGARAADCRRERFSSVASRLAAERPFTVSGMGGDTGGAPLLWKVTEIHGDYPRSEP